MLLFFREKNESYAKDNNFVCDRPRLPIGSFYFQFSEVIGPSTMRIDLFNGKIIGNISTASGSMLNFTVIASTRYDVADVIAIQVSPLSLFRLSSFIITISFFLCDIAS